MTTTQTRSRDALVTALVARQGVARARVETGVLVQLRRLVTGMRGRWYDPKSLDTFHTSASALVRQGQVVTGNLTGAYVDRTLVDLGLTPARGAVSLPAQLREVAPADEWERPAKEYRRLRVTGIAELQAELAAEARAERMATMDLALAAREASRQRLQVAGVTGYRRVIHPELAKSGSCGLCVVASDRVYARETLLPLHNGCNCTTLAIVGEDDPGLRINTADLTALYDAAGGESTREALQRIRVTVNEHGELGPILSRADHEFRAPSDVTTRDAPAPEPSSFLASV